MLGISLRALCKLSYIPGPESSLSSHLLLLSRFTRPFLVYLFLLPLSTYLLLFPPSCQTSMCLLSAHPSISLHPAPRSSLPPLTGKSTTGTVRVTASSTARRTQRMSISSWVYISSISAFTVPGQWGGDTRCMNTGLTSPETKAHIHDAKVYTHDLTLPLETGGPKVLGSGSCGKLKGLCHSSSSVSTTAPPNLGPSHTHCRR